MSRKKNPIIEYRHYSLPLGFPVILLSGERWRISEIKSDRLHFHNCLEIGMCHSDSGIIELNNTEIPFKEGDVTCIPRFLPHTTYSTHKTASLWSYIFFSPNDLFRNLFSSTEEEINNTFKVFKPTNFIYSLENYPKINLLMTTIINELEKQDLYHRQSVLGLLLALYIELLRNCYAKEDTKFKEITQIDNDVFMISPVLEYINQNYMQQITMDTLSDICHLSTSHFRRKFHEIMGTAPLDYLNSTRIDEACLLIKSTDDSILTISEKVGFQSISNFNKCFTKLMGVSPRNWRKKALQTEAQSAKATILEFTGWI